MGWEFEEPFFGTYPTPGVTRETAVAIRPGGSGSGLVYPSYTDDEYVTLYNRTDATYGWFGWYKITPNFTGMVRVVSNFGTITVWTSSGDLVGARFNLGNVYLFFDVTAGQTYYLRLNNANSENLNFTMTKVAPVIHVFQPFTNVRLSTNGNLGSLNGGTAILDWESEFSGQPRYGVAKDLLVDLPAMPVPPGVLDATDAGIADIRYIVTGRSTGAAISTGPAFLFTSANGSSSTYWTQDWLWSSGAQHERWISLRNFNGSFAVLPSNFIGGTVPGWYGDDFNTLAVGRMINGAEGEQAIIDLSTTGIRMSWFSPMPATTILPGDLATRQKFFEGRD